MNKLRDAFIKYFDEFYYYENSGRAYIEHSFSEHEGYTGEVGFFHFSLKSKTKNAFLNSRILFFIKKYYPESCKSVILLFQHCIKINAIISIVSCSHNRFSLRISQGDAKTRVIISNICKKFTGNNFIFPHKNLSCPTEINFDMAGEDKIKSISVYQKIPAPINTSCHKYYLNENNIFLIILCKEYNNYNTVMEEKIIYKLYECLSPKLLIDNRESMIEILKESGFESSKIYINQIEKNFQGYKLYFTYNYMVES